MSGAENFKLAWVRQVHSAEVVEVVQRHGELEYRPDGIDRDVATHPPPADALVTCEPGILLSIRAADCLPVLMADPRRRAIGAVHAGWRGALERVAGQAVRDMDRIYGCRGEDIVAALGPSIRACCYEVGEEVVNAFGSRFRSAEKFFRPIRRAPGDPRLSPSSARQQPGSPAACLDLVAVVRLQLEEAGLLPSHIDVLNFCTSCRTDLFFSYRREGASTGRMMAFIGMHTTR